MIEVDHLHKAYGTTTAIRDVTFGVEPGEILGFLGPNGAGKTTTMRILAGYLPATSGTARVAGFDVHRNSMAVRQHIGYLPETPPLYLDMTVVDYLHFVARIKGLAAGDRPQRVGIALARCGLEDKAGVIIRKLSKGYRQRVGIAQAIVHDPPVIILDEPTSGLDPRQNSEVRQLIRSLAGDHTIILSTHILPEVSATCNRIAIINQGQVVATDSPEALMVRLTGQLSYRVVVRGDRAAVLQRLQSVPGVAQVEALGPEPGGDHRLGFQVVAAPEADPGEAIAIALVEGGFGLGELRRQRVSLEDVFLNLTTEEPPYDPELDGNLESAQDSPPQDDPDATPSTTVDPEAASEATSPAPPA